jgi:hypothetical protein
MGLNLASGRLIGARVIRAALVAVALALSQTPASAQSWWPFGGDDRPPIPKEPVYRGPPAGQQPVPAPIPPAANQPPPAPGATNWATKNPICLQLEQRLVQEGQKGNAAQTQLPAIENEIRQVDRTFNTGSSQLDRNCYESFLFTRTFKASPQCHDLQRQVDQAKRRLTELEAQRQQIMGSSGRSYQDDIIHELARNNCGANYVDQARRREGGVWQDEESASNNSWTPQGGAGGATYKTVCVRLCDGFYFPVSFSTLPSHFTQDAEVCQSKCAAPTELYYHPNPGGSMDQALALKTQEPYTRLKVAFRYRKEFVNGCSCKEAEYVPATGTTADKKADGAAPASAKTSAYPPRRADTDLDPVAPNAAPPVNGAPITTGSTAPAAAAVPVQAAASPVAVPPAVQPAQPVPRTPNVRDVVKSAPAAEPPH